MVCVTTTLCILLTFNDIRKLGGVAVSFLLLLITQFIQAIRVHYITKVRVIFVDTICREAPHNRPPNEPSVVEV